MQEAMPVIGLGALAIGGLAWWLIRRHRRARRLAAAIDALAPNDGEWRRWLSAVSGEGQGRRQRVIARLEAGVPLKLVRDPENAHDPNAIKVQTIGGADCGWIPKGKNERLAEQLDSGAEVRAMVARVTGGERGKPSLGLVIEIAIRR